MKSPEQASLQLEARPLRKPEATIWRILERDHRGRENAIKMPDLADKAGIPTTRALQALIRYLRMECGKPIGSSCNRTKPGYFRIVKPEDLEEFFRQLLNRGRSILVVAYRVRNSNELKNILGQLDTLAGEGQ